MGPCCGVTCWVNYKVNGRILLDLQLQMVCSWSPCWYQILPHSERQVGVICVLGLFGPCFAFIVLILTLLLTLLSTLNLPALKESFPWMEASRPFFGNSVSAVARDSHYINYFCHVQLLPFLMAITQIQAMLKAKVCIFSLCAQSIPGMTTFYSKSVI